LLSIYFLNIVYPYYNLMGLSVNYPNYTLINSCSVHFEELKLQKVTLNSTLLKLHMVIKLHFQKSYFL